MRTSVIAACAAASLLAAADAHAEQGRIGGPNAAYLTPRGWHADAKAPDLKARPVLGLRRWQKLRAQKRLGITDADRDLIMSVADDYQVPAGLLVGLWTAETGRLRKGWSRREWYSADRMRKYGSQCARHYGIVKCRENWTALGRICAQKRGGRAICDPTEVYCSYAIALGPMQHLARRWSPADGQWGGHVVDYDGDGAYDPHTLADGMASAARHVRFDYEAALTEGRTDANAWRAAVWSYLGGANRGYEKRVYQGWMRWCAVKGYCRR